MKAVILAGGIGSRLKPFTDIIPKPLLPLGEKSVMEVQIEQLKKGGVSEIFLAINYKADYVKSFFGDGSTHGIKINYSEESQPLGTCGPIALLKEELKEPFILMNGDILTKANFADIYKKSLDFKDSCLTIVTKVITTPFRYGSIESEGDYIKSVNEKPDLKFEILSGIYVLKPQVFKYIPDGKYFGIDNLIHTLLESREPISKILLKDYWLDIGVVEDYEKAREVYKVSFRE